jgi:transcriptional regulator with XRE-family HTH domain
MVDISGMPPTPYITPDPRECKDFAEFLRRLTDKSRGGVSQVHVARAAGAKPHAVTKWLSGGSIEVERLARIAEWCNVPFAQLRQLVDEPKLKTMDGSMMVAEPNPAYPPASLEGEIAGLWKTLTPTNKKQLLAMARVLKSNQPKAKK